MQAPQQSVIEAQWCPGLRADLIGNAVGGQGVVLIRSARKGPCRESQGILIGNEVEGPGGGGSLSEMPAESSSGKRRGKRAQRGRDLGAGLAHGYRGPEPGWDRSGSRCTRTGGAQGEGSGP